MLISWDQTISLKIGSGIGTNTNSYSLAVHNVIRGSAKADKGTLTPVGCSLHGITIYSTVITIE